MKTKNKNLRFNKNTLVELNNETMSSIKGGSWTVVVDYINDKLKTITQ